MSAFHCSASECGLFTTGRVPFCSRHWVKVPWMLQRELKASDRETEAYREALASAISTVALRERMGVAG